MEFLLVFLGVIFVNNFVLAKFLGLCPFVGVSKKTDTALGMGMAVTFVMTLASMVTWIIHRFLLIPSESNVIYLLAGLFDSAADWRGFNFVDVLQTLTFILVIASLVQFVEIVMRKVSPPLYESLGIFLPLITTNCAVMGVALLNADMFFAEGAGGMVEPIVGGSFFLSIVHGFGAGIGFTLVMLLMSGIREHLEKMPLPESFKGVPIAFVCTGCMALAFMGFAGLI